MTVSFESSDDFLTEHCPVYSSPYNLLLFTLSSVVYFVLFYNIFNMILIFNKFETVPNFSIYNPNKLMFDSICTFIRLTAE